MEKITKEYQLKVVKSEVTKHKVGESSSYSTPSKYDKYFFIATFEFHTGSVIKITMCEPRVEFAQIDTLSINYADTDKAKKLALEEYQRAFDVISSNQFLYSRQKGHYCNLYGIDATAPTGVSLMCSCSSYRLADFICMQLGKTASSLSPTEKY